MKGHNSANTGPLAPIFLPQAHCVMVQVWYKFYQNGTKGIEVIMQNLISRQNDGILELQNFGNKNFAGGINNNKIWKSAYF